MKQKFRLFQFLQWLAILWLPGSGAFGNEAESEQTQIQQLYQAVVDSQMEWGDRVEAIYELTSIKTRGAGVEVNQHLLRILRDQSVPAKIRVEAAQAMLDFAPRINPVTRKVLEPLFDECVSVRQELALSLTRNLSSVPSGEQQLLQGALRHKDPYVKLCAAWLLKEREVVKTLVQHKDLDLALAAISTLGRFSAVTTEELFTLQLKLSVRIAEATPKRPKIHGLELMDALGIVRVKRDKAQTEAERQKLAIEEKQILGWLAVEGDIFLKRADQSDLALHMMKLGQNNPAGTIRAALKILTGGPEAATLLRTRSIRILGGIGQTPKGRQAVTEAKVQQQLQQVSKEDRNQEVRRAAQETVEKLKQPVKKHLSKSLMIPGKKDTYIEWEINSMMELAPFNQD